MSKGFWAGLIIGGIAGVAATIVFGPELSQETRSRLREEGLRLRARADEVAGAARVEADALLERLRVLIDEQGTKLQEAIAESKRAAADKQRELRAKFEQSESEGEAQL